VFRFPGAFKMAGLVEKEIPGGARAHPVELILA
jgi:hypothetical protein